jgi:hypothetical protein
MAELRWRTNKPAAEAKEMIQKQLDKTGYGDSVNWNGDTFSASIGMGFMLDVSGTVHENEVTIDKCGGVSGGMTLGKLKKMMEYLFPGGEVSA